jgi:hypothetical protein
MAKKKEIILFESPYKTINYTMTPVGCNDQVDAVIEVISDTDADEIKKQKK